MKFAVLQPVHSPVTASYKDCASLQPVLSPLENNCCGSPVLYQRICLGYARPFQDERKQGPVRGQAVPPSAGRNTIWKWHLKENSLETCAHVESQRRLVSTHHASFRRRVALNKPVTQPYTLRVCATPRARARSSNTGRPSRPEDIGSK